MLVHICCSVDSHYFLSELRKIYPSERLVGFFYNPNIHPKSEYDLRLNDVRRSCDMLGITLLEGDYELEKWLGGVKGLESAPEKGERCIKCFDIRLEKSAQVAREMGEERFTTTLLASPMKEQEILYSEGDGIAREYGLRFIKIDVRKDGGVQKQNALAKRDNLYRQNYCGCKFALKQQRDKQERVSLEMISEISGRALPGSIEQRQEVFRRRDELERAGQKYILGQNLARVWRLLWGIVRRGESGVVIYSYILANSACKSVKIGEISWVNVAINRELRQEKLKHSDGTKNIENMCAGIRSTSSGLGIETMQGMISDAAFGSSGEGSVCIGISSKDDSIFMALDDFNMLAGSAYGSVLEMMYAPPCYEMEMEIRTMVCGGNSLNPIVILDSRVEGGISLDILSVFQDERLFYTIPLVEKLAES